MPLSRRHELWAAFGGLLEAIRLHIVGYLDMGLEAAFEEIDAR